MGHGYATLYHFDVDHFDFLHFISQMKVNGIDLRGEDGLGTCIWNDDLTQNERVIITDEAREKIINERKFLSLYWWLDQDAPYDKMWCSVRWFGNGHGVREYYDMAGRIKYDRLKMCYLLEQRFREVVMEGRDAFLVVDIPGALEDVDWNAIAADDGMLCLGEPAQSGMLPDIIGVRRDRADMLLSETCNYIERIGNHVLIRTRDITEYPEPIIIGPPGE